MYYRYLEGSQEAIFQIYINNNLMDEIKFFGRYAFEFDYKDIRVGLIIETRAGKNIERKVCIRCPNKVRIRRKEIPDFQKKAPA
jgi:hypothetical protein